MNPVVVVGDALLDRNVDGRAERLCPDAPAPVVSDLRTRSRPGGGALAATLAASDGRDVTLVTAIADDAVGHELLTLLAEMGVETINLGCTAPTAEKVRVRVGGHTLLRMDHGGPGCGKVGMLIQSAQRALELAGVVLVSDYGRGLTAQPDMRVALAPQVGRQVVWDPHPRGAQPVGGARIVTPNEAEAAMAGGDGLGGLASLTAQARLLARRWEAGGVAITLGARGALLVQGDNPPMMAPAVPRSGDACGAGDRFAATLAAMLADGALPSEACIEAVAAASDYVAGRSAGALPDARSMGLMADASTAVDTVGSVRAAGGTVVATGGCFDLLHRGHVRMLESARRLGDCLVVLLNSDASVRRLKGSARPIVAAADRAAVLGALECVDDVIEFEEDTPCAALEQLRPDVFAKGGDYGLDELPEQATMAQWGGQCVVLPYLQGRSTSALFQEVQRRGLA